MDKGVTIGEKTVRGIGKSLQSTDAYSAIITLLTTSLRSVRFSYQRPRFFQLLSVIPEGPGTTIWALLIILRSYSFSLALSELFRWPTQTWFIISRPTDRLPIPTRRPAMFARVHDGLIFVFSTFSHKLTPKGIPDLLPVPQRIRQIIGVSSVHQSKSKNAYSSSPHPTYYSRCEKLCSLNDQGIMKS